MKIKLTLLGSLASIGAAASLNAQSAITPAAGYHTETVVTGFNMIGVNVGNAVSAAGAFDGPGAVDADVDFTTLLTGGLPYTVQNITTGDIAAVTSFTADTLTTTPALTTALDDKYEIRQDQTIASLFGAANEVGLQEGTATTADVIWLYNGDTTYTRVFYNNVAGVPPFGLGLGWRGVGSGSTNFANAVVPFQYGLFIQRRGAAPLDLVFVGHVRGDDADDNNGHGAVATNIGLANGFNAVNRIVPVGISLAEAGMATALTPGTDSTGDVLWNPQGDATYLRYFNNNVPGVPPFGIGNGLRRIGGGATPADDVVLASGFLIQRRAASGAIAVTVPDRLDL